MWMPCTRPRARGFQGAHAVSDAGARRAVFLDRDGTISEEMGFLNHLSRFRLFPFAPLAIRRLNESGVPGIVDRKQSGVARGYFPESLVHRVHEKMRTGLAAGGAHVDGICFCPHRPDDVCSCRKPHPGMLERAAREHKLALAGSYVVGDRSDDLETAQRIGGPRMFGLAGHRGGEDEFEPPLGAKPP